MSKPKFIRQKKRSQILHLGCGLTKYPNSLGVDINPKTAADVVHDLNKFPYPFKNNQFSSVFADHILEHLDDIPKVFTEIYRITKPGGLLHITAPHFSSLDSFTDPTHKHFFTSMSFDYFIPGTRLYKLLYSNVNFKKIKVIAGPPNIANPLLKLLLILINKNLLMFEKRFAFIFPVGVIQFDLEVIK